MMSRDMGSSWYIHGICMVIKIKESIMSEHMDMT